MTSVNFNNFSFLIKKLSIAIMITKEIFFAVKTIASRLKESVGVIIHLWFLLLIVSLICNVFETNSR